MVAHQHRKRPRLRSALRPISRAAGSRRIRFGFLGLTGLVVLLVAWIGVTGAIAANSIRDAKSRTSAAQAALSAGDTATAMDLVPTVAASTSTARSMVSSPPWWLAEHTPFVGASVRAATQTITAVDLAATDALMPLTTASDLVSGTGLRGAGGAVNIDKLLAMQGPLKTAAAAVTEAQALANSIPTTGVIASVADQSALVADALKQLGSQIAAASAAVEVLPTMLGHEGDQRYFLAFTSPAEARGTGGFLGTYGILLAHNGALTLEHVGMNSELVDFPKPVLDLGAEYTNIYGNSAELWSGMNLSPHFPFAAKQWIEGWKRQTGQQLQGAISIDPMALAYLVGVNGPITMPDGTKLTEAQVVPYLTNGIYQQFVTDNTARKRYQVSIAKSTTKAMFGSTAAPAQLVKAMATAGGQQHLLVYSTDPAIEGVLEQWPISGRIDTIRGPFAMLVLNNLAGNKADFYIDRSLTYSTTACHRTTMHSQVSATLTNSMPKSHAVPTVATGRVDDHAKNAPPRSTRVSVELLLPMGSSVDSATLGGQPTKFALIAEAGRPGVFVKTDLNRRVPVQFAVGFTEPRTSDSPRVPEQPLVRAQTTAITQTTC